MVAEIGVKGNEAEGEVVRQSACHRLAVAFGDSAIGSGYMTCRATPRTEACLPRTKPASPQKSDKLCPAHIRDCKSTDLGQEEWRTVAG